MKKIIKNCIIPLIIVLLFSIIYFVFVPMYKSSKALKQIFISFDSGLSDLKIEYQKQELDAKEYGAKEAYSYMSNEKLVMLYVFSKNSSSYKFGVLNGFIQSKKNEESKLYGVYMNNCLLFMESEFPSSEQVLNLFMSLSKDYETAI